MSANSRRFILNLALAGLVLVLAGLVAWLGLSPDETHTGLTKLDATAVTDIRVEREGAPDLHLVKEGEDWKLTEPFEIVASPYRATMLAKLADERSLAHYDIGERDLTRYGLSPGRAQVILNGQTRIVFGDVNPLNHQRYLRVENRIHLIDDKVFPVLQAPVASYVGPGILPSNAEITALELPDQRLMRSDAGWALDPPQPDIPADDIQALIDAWKRAEALWAQPLTDTGPAPGTPVVKITLADGRSLSFGIHQTESDLILARRDLGFAYTLPVEQAVSLLELKPAPPTESAQPGDP